MEAFKIADPLVKSLIPHCDHAMIAGSIRRCVPEVKDIDIVCHPKDIYADQKSMFPEVISSQRTPAFMRTIQSWPGAKIKTGKLDGRQMTIELSQGISMCVFMPQLHDFWRIFTIRCGPADFVHYRIAARWSAMGWTGTHHGLRRIDPKESDQRPPAWKSEPEFWEWLGIPYVDPKHRKM